MQSKSDIRNHYKKVRENLALTHAQKEFMSEGFFNIAEENFSFPNVSGYEAMHHELDLIFLEKLISKKGWPYAFPIMQEGSRILKFQTSSRSSFIIPDVILVPLVCFDDKGYRLGYGGGYYDATLSTYLSNQHTFLTIGIAYDEQRYQRALPKEPHDVALDYVLTPTKIYRFK